jgi:CHAT domain-containing protein
VTVFEARFEEAEELRQSGSYAAALNAYCALLHARTTIARDVLGAIQTIDIVLMERISELAMFHDKPLAAAELLDASYRIFLTAGNIYSASWASVKAAYAYLVAGKWNSARAALHRLSPQAGDLQNLELLPDSIQQWECCCHWPGVHAIEQQALIVRILLELGRQAASTGSYRGSGWALERASSLAATDHPLMVSIRVPVALELASSRLERGDLRGCNSILRRLSGTISENPLESIGLIELEAKCAVLTGDFGKALVLLDQLRSKQGEIQAGPATAGTALNLAHLCILVNQTERAARIARELLHGAEQSGDTLLAERSRILLELTVRRGRSLAEGISISPSVTEWWEGNGAIPVTSVHSSVPVFESAGSRSFLDLFELRSLAFFWLLAAQNFNAAADYLQELANVFGQTDSMLILYRQMLLQGMVEYYKGNLSTASAYLQQVSETARELGVIHDCWQALRVIGWIGERMKDSGVAENARRESDRLLEQMASSLQGSDRPLFLLNKWTEEEERLATEADEIAREQRISVRIFRRPRRFLTQLQKTNRLLQRIDNFRKGIIENSIADAQRNSRLSSSSLSLGWRFAGPTALIRFLVLPDRVVILSLSRGRIHVGITAVTRIQVREQVGRIHAALRDSGPGAFANEMQHLTDLLQWRPLLGKLSPHVSRLLILPDDSLHGVPFSAMSISPALTGDRYRVTIGFDSGKHLGAVSSGTALGVALPLADGGYRELPNAKQEIERFQDWCFSQRLKVETLGPEANKDQIIASLTKAEYLHMACHGKFQVDAPDQSGLVLIHKDGPTETLSIRDLCGLDLSKLHLATFSSCWGADNFVLPGRFVISLPEICWRAGAHHILACLWEVVDEISVPFTQRFYEHLGHNPPDRALQLAQRDARASSLPDCILRDTADPYLWAGFQLYGTA